MDNAYNIARIFNELELEIISNMNATMKNHLKEETIEGFSWSQWQSEFLLAFSEYKRKNKEVLDKYTNTINSAIDESIRLAYQNGIAKQQIEILKATKKGYKTNKKRKKPLIGSFFKVNERKLEALIDASTKDLKKAEGRILRYTNDVYRQIPYKAQFFANTGATTTWKAVDMAVEEFLKNGINNIEYANGTRVNIASYAEMCIRTANKRAYLTGEGQMRESWGVHTVLVSSHASACPRCRQWQGRVYIDDVWSGGSVEEAKETGYLLLSAAINGGLYHPNCKDTHSTYFPGINTEPKEQTKEQLKESSRRYNLEQKQRYYERQVRKYARLEKGSLDIEDERYYREKKNKWHDKYKQHVEDNKDILREAPERIKTRGIVSEVFKNDGDNGTMKLNLQFFSRDSKDFETIYLSSNEYAHVMSELNTHLSEEQRKKEIITKAIGDYYYTIENNGFDNYRIIGKKPIDIDVDEWWDE